MIDPETRFSMWKSEQRRRERGLELRRAYLQSLEPEALPDLAVERGEGSDCCEVEVAS